MMDWDQAGPRISRMWRKLGGISERLAYARGEAGDVAQARQAAMFAEGCFSQATGDCDGFNISSLKPDPQP